VYKVGVSGGSSAIRYVFTQATAPSGQGEVEGSIWYNTTLNRLETYDGSSWSSIASSGYAGGNITIIPMNYSSVIQGTWANVKTTDSITGYKFQNNSGDGDELNYKIGLDSGTYTIGAVVQKDNNRGILDFELDGSSLGTYDCYSGSADDNERAEVTSVNVASAGLKTLGLKVNGKNGSSSGHYMAIGVIYIYRTA
jgi:hypothetical protein